MGEHFTDGTLLVLNRIMLPDSASALLDGPREGRTAWYLEEGDIAQFLLGPSDHTASRAALLVPPWGSDRYLCIERSHLLAGEAYHHADVHGYQERLAAGTGRSAEAPLMRSLQLLFGTRPHSCTRREPMPSCACTGQATW